MSEAIDEVITQARRSGQAPGDARSVVGTIDIAADDPLLERADEYVRAAFEQSLGGRPRGGSRRAGGTGRADRIPHGKTRRG